MCNDEALEAVRQLIEKLVPHIDDLRQKYNDVEEGFREGNLDRDTLGQLNQVIHLLETDSGAFEKLMEG
ncbi:MAG: hypothetical protein WC935_05355 [Thermoleophilia bacterium]